MYKKISNMITGRLVVLFVFGSLFAMMGFGQMGLFKTGELPYPSQNGLNVTTVSTSSDVFFDALDQFAVENELTIYRRVVENDQLKGFVFGQHKKEPNLTQDKSILRSISPIGVYYVDGNLSQDKEKKLNQLKADITVHPTGWQGIIGELLLGRSIRTKTFWMSIMLLCVSLLALKIAKIRQVMIARTLGKIRLNLLGETLSTALGVFGTGLLISVSNLYFGTVLFMSYMLMLAVIWLIICLTLFVIAILFYSYVQWIPMLAILKNKQTGRFFSYIWLLALVVSMSLMTTAVTGYQRDYQAAKLRQKSLAKWQVISNFAQLSITFPKFMEDMPKTSEERVEYDKKETAYHAKWQLFDRQFSEAEKIFIKVPPELAEMKEMDSSETTDAPDFNNPKHVMQIKNKWIAKTWQVSPKLVKLSQQLFERNKEIFKHQKPVTIYIPNKFKDHQSDILPVVTSQFINSGLTLDEFEIIMIPDDFKLFVSDITQIRDSDQPLTSVSGQIIAQYDYDKMPQTPQMARIISSTILDTLYVVNKIPKAVQVANLATDVTNFSDTYQNLVSYQKQAKGDITRSLVVMISLLFMQTYAVYEFLKLRLSLVVNKLTLLSLFGKSYLLVMLKSVSPLIVGVGIALSIASYMGADRREIWGSMMLYVLLIVVLVCSVLQLMRRRRVTILKGESDLM